MFKEKLGKVATEKMTLLFIVFGVIEFISFVLTIVYLWLNK